MHRATPRPSRDADEDPRDSRAQATERPPVSGRERLVLWLIAAAFLAVLGLWSVLTPIYGAPDEHAHINSAIRLTAGFDWPAPGEARMDPMVMAAREEASLPASDRSTFAELAESNSGKSGVDQMTQHPPLYYVLAAGFLNVIDFMQLRADVAFTALRLAGLVFMLPLPFLAWDATRRLTRSPKAAVVAAAAVFAVPQLAHIASSVSNDGLTILLCSVVAWLAVRVMTGDARWRVIIAIGVALGAALLTKGTSLPLVPFVIATLLIWPRDERMARRLVRAAVASVIAFVLGGWWWLRNLVVFRDLQPSGLAGSRKTVPWEPGTGPDLVGYLDLMWSRLSLSFWGDFGRLQYALPQFVTDVLTLAALAAVIAYFFVRDRNRLRMYILASLPAMLSVMLVVNTWRHYVRTQLTGGMQGRYYFVIIVVLIVMSAVAWHRLVAPQRRVMAGTVLLAVFAGVAVLGVIREYTGVYENDLYRLTRKGISAWISLSPAGAWGIVFAGGLALGLGVAAFVLAVRYVRTRTVAPVSAEAPRPVPA